MKVRYAVNDLVLFREARDIHVIAIEEIHGKHVRHKYGWQQVDEFHADVLERCGKRRRLWGFLWWVKVETEEEHG